MTEIRSGTLARISLTCTCTVDHSHVQAWRTLDSSKCVVMLTDRGNCALSASSYHTE